MQHIKNKHTEEFYMKKAIISVSLIITILITIAGVTVSLPANSGSSDNQIAVYNDMDYLEFDE